MGGARIDLEARSGIVKAIQAGTRRSKIAREFGVSQAAVARIGREAGIVPVPLTIGQKKSQRMATEALRIRARRLRNEQSLKSLEDADRIRKQIFAPALVYDWGGGGDSYGYREHKLAEPDARSKRDLAIAYAILIDKHIALEKLEDESNTSNVKGAIVQLVDRLEAAELTTKITVADT